MIKEELEELIIKGKSTREIAMHINCSQTNIRYWLNKYGLKTNIKLNLERSGFISVDEFVNGRWELYSYLYGLYLGDGCVYRHKEGVYALMISLDKKYPELVKEVSSSLSEFSKNKVREYLRNESCYNLIIYHKQMLDLFPKFGKGNKHKNKVYVPEILKLNIHHESMLKGLFQSDGSCYYDKHNKKSFYNFTNKSQDIIEIFTSCLEYLGIKYDLQIRNNNVFTVGIRRLPEFAKFNNIVGIKK